MLIGEIDDGPVMRIGVEVIGPQPGRALRGNTIRSPIAIQEVLVSLRIASTPTESAGSRAGGSGAGPEKLPGRWS